MHKILLYIFILAVSSSVSYGISINEIMHNPNGTDTGHEWVEVYNNDSDIYNLTGWKLNTGNTDHTLNPPPANGGQGTMILNPGGYLVIAQDAILFLADYSNYTGPVIDSSWSDLLNSANETVWIKNSTEIFDNITYSPVSAEGKTICIINSSFAECEPTPGAVNKPKINQQTNQTNTTQQNTTLICNLELSIGTNSVVYEIGTINFNLIVNDTTCNNTMHNSTVNYFVEDIFGNFVKSPMEVTSELLCTKTIGRQWTPDGITGSEAYYIKASLVSTGCNDTDVSNNNASKVIVVKGSSPQFDSSINITSVNVGSDNEIKYGETAEVSISIYKGNTSKTSIDIFVKNSTGNKISDITNMNLENKFTPYNLKVPVQLKSNCDGTFSDGTYAIVAEGLDAIDSKNINVKGSSSSVCKTTTIVSSSGTSGGGGGTTTVFVKQNVSLYEVVNYPPNVHIEEEFTTTVRITNNFTSQKNFTVYSYVFKDNNPVSLGLDNNENKWKGTYDANKQSVELSTLASTILYLKNKIENTTEKGVYKFRVRVRVDDKNNDITNEINVAEPPVINAINDTELNTSLPTTEMEITNQSQNDTESSYEVITGLSVGQMSDPINVISSSLLTIIRIIFGF